MPSTHSATITYYASYISAACLSLPLHKSLEYNTSLDDGSLFNIRNLVPLVILPWATMVVFSRVWLGHHTWKQVAVGSTYGAVFAGVWFAIWVWTGLDVLGIQVEDTVVRFLDLT
jgi:membrane-associated phospholipid phosphatase